MGQRRLIGKRSHGAIAQEGQMMEDGYTGNINSLTCEKSICSSSLMEFATAGWRIVNISSSLSRAKTSFRKFSMETFPVCSNRFKDATVTLDRLARVVRRHRKKFRMPGTWCQASCLKQQHKC
ncbi:hypothetical protein [Desulfocicer niacini]